MHPETVRRQEAERLRLELARRAGRGRPAGEGVPEREAAGVDRAARRWVDHDFVALLENVRSLWNVGSMFRTADGAGIGRLILTGITAHPPRKEISKTALGADEVVAWEYDPDPPAAARRLRAAGYRLLALETGEASVPWSAVVPDGRLCLIVGHEVAGVSAALCALADQCVALPMRGLKDSLNVAVAFGVAAYGLAEARRAPAGAAWTGGTEQAGDPRAGG
jgi:tRNA G18 (ribose-2'-O)-methylase SpoU